MYKNKDAKNEIEEEEDSPGLAVWWRYSCSSDGKYDMGKKA